jgi:CubicO group peptidase (beta-lactamase class C family)
MLIRTALRATLVLSLALSPVLVIAQATPGDLEAELRAIAAAAYPDDGPGAAVIVVRDGEVLLRDGFGMAHLELGVPIEPDMVFRIGSLTKQFTAVGILMLVEEGSLALSDPLTKFLPDYPLGERVVTVEQLIAHTSGIRSYTDLPQFSEMWRQDKTTEELIATFSHEPFVFEPGARVQYNNSGYVLLGAIIEQVSGMPWHAFLHQRIFEPLGLSVTGLDQTAAIIPRRVPGYTRAGYTFSPSSLPSRPSPGYTRAGDTWANAAFLTMTLPHAAGALVSSVDDLARWDRAIAGGELLSAEGWARALTAFPLADGSSTGYAAGWLVGHVGPHASFEHGGGIHGFAAYGLHVPSERLFVAVLANADMPPAMPSAVALDLAAAVLGLDLHPDEVAIDPARLDDYVGVYRIDDETTGTITREGDRLFAQSSGASRLEIYPIGEDRFALREAVIVIEFVREAGEVVAMNVIPRVGPPIRAVRTDEAPAEPPPAVALDEAALQALAGTYRLQPNFEITVSHAAGRLYAQATAQPRLALIAESPTRFRFEAVDAVLEFTLDGGRASSLTLYQGGRVLVAPRID